MLSVEKLSVVMLSVVMLSVVKLSSSLRKLILLIIFQMMF